MDNLHNGAVILLHAVSKDNAEALDKIIKEIKAQGYSISSFDL
jgi:peptidoglycan-N-acetylmuramic acid deacetylase